MPNLSRALVHENLHYHEFQARARAGGGFNPLLSRGATSKALSVARVERLPPHGRMVRLST
jgi:hypothetical protein